MGSEDGLGELTHLALGVAVDYDSQASEILRVLLLALLVLLKFMGRSPAIIEAQKGDLNGTFETYSQCLIEHERSWSNSYGIRTSRKYRLYG